MKTFPELEPDDVRSTGMGQQGEDIQFSPAGAKRVGLSIECKSRDRIAVYSLIEQAKTNTTGEREAVAVVKQNRSRPLVIVDAEYFFKLLKASKTDESSF